ncbi:hypothetical protein HG536_0A02360 [Torulaspora globosa]|uniref:Uncharacterized protein n=1 Tax=Torulaspora globosa TaxID=48254 RepID=A0A7G3ZA83_9SACH|nr:uncharacterized protein HG536_0A02360 [Torulaspora globosa]QLL30419.1 hypothetical protein HG536_0A02360 [Torulaspora globosa]
MEIYVYLIVFAVVLLFVVLLPMVSGIGSFSIDKPVKKSSGSTKESKMKEPFKFKLRKEDNEPENASAFSSARKTGKFQVDPKTGLKRRVIGKFDEDPNNYDYDLDDLLNEDRVEEEKAQVRRLQKFQGSTEKAYEELV